MQLHFLGTTGYHPNERRNTACLFMPELGVCLDAGTGIYRVRELLKTRTMDIFLSHAHLDHSVGLTFLYDVFYQREMDRVTVHCAVDKVAAIEQCLFNEKLFPVPPNFDIQVFQKDPVELSDGGKVSVIPLEHPGGCHGFRFDWPDRSMAYITDTTAKEDAPYIEAIRNVDTLIHECNFPDGWEDWAIKTGHSCLTPVAKVAQLANAKRLYLSHVNPLDESETPLDLSRVDGIFSPITIAQEKMVIEV